MSSKFKVLTIALVAILAVGTFASQSLADVTGSFGTHISIHPQTTTSEISLIDFDIQNDLNITVVISGLSTTFHTHFGIAGVEDVIVSASATLGALDIQSQLVFGRFAGICLAASGPSCLAVANNPIPLNDSLLFIKKRVTMTLSLGGVTFTNLALFEDTTFPETLTPTAYQTQNFAFGDALTVSGQTPSGISISAQTGLCVTRTPNVIKKHSFPYEVNPACATTPKPDILFDFERLTVSGVPLAPGVTGSSVLSCVTITACSFTLTAAVAGGPIPFTANFTFTNLLSLTFGGANLVLSSGAGSLTIGITAAGQIGAVRMLLNATINPDTNPATLVIDARITPGVGLNLAFISLVIERAGLLLGVDATFAGGPPATFSDITFSITVPGSALTLEATMSYETTGSLGGDIYLTVNF
jgi:hypothetical protein